MTTRIGSKIQTTMLLGSVLMISACASITTSDTNKSAEAVVGRTDEATHTTIQKGKFETPPEIQLSTVNKSAASGNSVSEAIPNATQTATASATRINHKEASVHVRHAPTAKSRSIAILKAGQPIEVLETRDSWVKITWQKGNAVKQGWLKKVFVEGN